MSWLFALWALTDWNQQAIFSTIPMTMDGKPLTQNTDAASIRLWYSEKWLNQSII